LHKNKGAQQDKNQYYNIHAKKFLNFGADGNLEEILQNLKCFSEYGALKF